MTTISLKPHEKDLGGGFKVRRLLPAVECRSVGPFVFFDHMGPVVQQPADNFDVRPHPHIGLATVTYLFEGAMMHRDSLGSVQRIEPGAINWMTAGRGIVHSERRPADLSATANRLQGLQLWTALPKSHEECEPAFVHTPADAIPAWQAAGASGRVMIGSAFGLTSPVSTFAETLYVDFEMPAGTELVMPQLHLERAIYLVAGRIDLGGPPIEPHEMAVLPVGDTIKVRAIEAARFVLVGGEPVDAYRYMCWNFVSSSRERIEQAKEDWRAQRMGTIAGETEFIPLPDH